MQLEQSLCDYFHSGISKLPDRAICHRQEEKNPKNACNTPFDTKICITVSHPLLFFELNKRNTVTLEGFLAETAYLGKKLVQPYQQVLKPHFVTTLFSQLRVLLFVFGWFIYFFA